MNDIVKYHNDLNTVPFRRFNSNEMDLFFAVCAKMRDKGTETVTFTFDQLRYLSNYKPTAMKRFVNDLVQTYDKYLNLIYSIEVDGVIEKFVLFTGFKVDSNNKTVDITINTKFDYILNDLTGNFTRFELEEFTNLKSSYSKTMYRLLKQWRTVGKKEWAIEDFRELLDIPPSYQMNKVDSKVLSPILEELSEPFSGLKVKKIKRGRGSKVVALQFTFSPENISRNKTKNKKNIVEKLPDWAKEDTPKEDTLITAQEAFNILMRLEKYRRKGKIDPEAIEEFNKTYGKGLFEKLYSEI